jgi:hypothetical protein
LSVVEFAFDGLPHDLQAFDEVESLFGKGEG